MEGWLPTVHIFIGSMIIVWGGRVRKKTERWDGPVGTHTVIELRWSLPGQKREMSSGALWTIFTSKSTIQQNNTLGIQKYDKNVENTLN